MDITVYDPAQTASVTIGPLGSATDLAVPSLVPLLIGITIERGNAVVVPSGLYYLTPDSSSIFQPDGVSRYQQP